MAAAINNNNRSKMQMVRNEMLHIPNDIVVQILLRLPAKSLLRLRWACKYWFNLITSDHDFIKTHLLHSITTTTHSDEILSIRSTIILSNGLGDCYKLFQRSLEYNDHATGVLDVSSEVCIALPLDRCYPKILGSTNGLILVWLYENMSRILCIWNLCTKEYRVLPHPLPHYTDGVPGYHDLYGFGYDHTTDDYKVLRYMYYWNNINDPADLPHYYSDVQVYTLGKNSWRRIGPNPYRFRHYQKVGVFVNGALYWMDSLHENIISFDIVKEKFEHVTKLPNLGDHDENWETVKLQVFEGSLCVVALNIKNPLNYHYRRRRATAEVWVMMNNYAENNSEYLWTKLTTIPNLGDCYFSIAPIRFTRNGEILMVKNQKDLLLYDPKNSNVKTLCRICEQPIYHFIVFSESLVSLNSGTYMGQERTKEQLQEEEENAKMALRKRS